MGLAIIILLLLCSLVCVSMRECCVHASTSKDASPKKETHSLFLCVSCVHAARTHTQPHAASRSTSSCMLGDHGSESDQRRVQQPWYKVWESRAEKRNILHCQEGEE